MGPGNTLSSGIQGGDDPAGVFCFGREVEAAARGGAALTRVTNVTTRNN
ncbi:hypothetical protein [Amycolatopsis sp. DG1A-15b]|nr:hypothetical protein [Amycolatopsis sp. DG1A-15b]WIX91351.1 hypothetical protein QRY02_13230 [Amycolatopsis sp. DG1A-15b]